MSTGSWTFPQNLLKKIPPQHYLHVLDSNTNVVRVEVGPMTYRCLDQETAIYGPAKMVVIPPHHYVLIANPVITTETHGKKEVALDQHGQALLRHGEQEVRLEQDPFPLYPGEVLVEKPKPLQILEANTALLLEASLDFEDRICKDVDGDAVQRKCGTRWYFEGPGTYIPQPEVKVVELVKATVVKPTQALRLKATKNFVDRTGVERLTGSEWHYTEEGFYLPAIEEQILKVEQPVILTNQAALHLRALYDFTDASGVERKAGSEWLVTNDQMESIIPHVSSAVVGTVNITTIGKREWMALQNPYENDKPTFGKQVIIRGDRNFFLKPGEEIVSGPTQVEVLTADEALVVSALKTFTDNSSGRNIRRQAGEKWLVLGPKEYWPPLEVNVIRRTKALVSVGNYYLFQADSLILGAVGFLFLLILLFLVF
eukprot:TRINITY_DN5052_c0_g1_i1.p1 TRINITY_DN5052_c0_g1~~TRINITY_DN5052_c0_g1_i1.p1  ORF type:complete len:428 (+),score=93.24 TRINITY_DN5052_c0_g1_i1:56-1339(+)